MNNFIQNSIYQHNWIVPRSVMCTLFWTGVILVFTGMILLVTSKHKDLMYQSWGGVLLGLGLCVLLICLILCIHAYCVMAADAAATASGEQETNGDLPPFTVGPVEAKSAMGNLHHPPDTTNANVYSNACNLANGRKPRSMVQLIPPPKYGISVTKPVTHTVRFFLSGDTNDGSMRDDEEEEGKTAALQLKTMPKEETEKQVDRRLLSKTTSDATTGGGDVVGGDNIRSSAGRLQSLSPAKERRLQTKTMTVGVDQRFSSDKTPVLSSERNSVLPSYSSGADKYPILQSERNPVQLADRYPVLNPADRPPVLSSDRNPVLSSDCDSLLSVETIIPRTLLGNKTPEDQADRMTATPYSFLDDIPQRYDGQEEDEEGKDEEIRRRRRVIVDPSEGRLSSSSGSAKKKKDSGPFPGPSPSSVSRDDGKAVHSSRQAHRHSYAKSKQQHYSSETSPSPGSPEPLEDAAVSSFPPVKSVMGAKPPGGSARPPTVPLMVAPGAWSITRSFGPSSVTVTPLGTHGPTGVQHERHVLGGDGVQAPHHHQHRRQGGEFTLSREPAMRGHAKQDERDLDEYRSGMRDDPVGTWRSMERHRQQHPAAADRHMPPAHHPHHPSPAPGLLEITESKATVYDNVQYFQM